MWEQSNNVMIIEWEEQYKCNKTIFCPFSSFCIFNSVLWVFIAKYQEALGDWGHHQHMAVDGRDAAIMEINVQHVCLTYILNI